jgi:zinc protease
MWKMDMVTVAPVARRKDYHCDDFLRVSLLFNPMKTLVWTSVAALMLAGGFDSPAIAQNIPIQEHMTPNGMKVLVVEDPSIPNVAMYTWFHVGSRNEHEGITGISHFFEHMMFNGAKKYGPGQFDDVLALAGGENNAYTSNDVTVYQDWFPASALETAFDLEADRIQYLTFAPALVKSEREVVYSERRSSVDNNNPELLNEQMEATAFEAAPYHWPVLGWPTDIESWTQADLKAYFAMGYSPSNATMIVVGEVKAADVFKLADQYIGPIPVHDPPPPIRTKEPVQLGERRVYVNKFAEAPLLDIGYHAVNAKSPDYWTFQMINNLLSTGESSRFYKTLVDGQQLAVTVNSGMQPMLDPGLFEVFAQPREGVPVEKLEKAIYAEMDKLAATGPTVEELQKAKTQEIADYYRALRSIAGRAQEVGEAEVIFGDYHLLPSVEQKVNAVTAADVQRVMKEYLKPTNRTVATLIPTADDGPAAAATEVKK